ncbi:dysbindin-like [Cololabis saira]|uniref:dysbindin-like n=1 Tax=Cololabis saira TaxID=129043 RepID=UPI002AD42926|nr:dysbindin-like [Cololabis saira]
MLSGRPSPLSITSDTLTLSRNMSAPAANLHSKRLPSAEQERGQARPELDAAQHLLLRDRQRFFEEVFQHDVDVYLSSTHLSIRDYKRTPIGSVSSMEVNVDLLDQMELIDLSDQEGLDVFYSSAGEDGALTSPRPGNSSSEEPLSKGLLRRVLERPEGKSRVSSTSSDSSCDSQSTDVARGDTPLLGSDTEETQSGSVHRTAPSAEREERSLSS